MSVTLSSITIPGAPLGGHNPLPMFRDHTHHRSVSLNSSYPDHLKEKLGYEAGARYLPYRMQDRYSRQRSDMQIDTIELENEHLKAVFMPQYGGRLYSLWDKRTKRDILYTNPVFQTGNLAILNAWFSGGIEWNIGQIGHTFTTSSPLHAAKLVDDSGQPFLRLYEYERCKNVFWHIDFHLPQGSDKLIVYVRMINDNDHSVPMYWWTNTAVPETKQSRVFSTTDEVIYYDQTIKGFGHGHMPELASVPGEDVSYPINFPFSNEYFFQTPASDQAPWEAVCYEDGKLFYERSTALLRYRKMFCWGHHPGGRRWCDFLSNPGEGNYIEIQAGFAPTQLHGLDMPAHTTWDFTQVIGLSNVSPEQAHQTDWATANRYVYEQINELITEQQIYELHGMAQRYADQLPVEKLYDGSGWGLLEQRRRAAQEPTRTIPAGFDFNLLNEQAGEETKDWQQLLMTGTFPDRPVHEVPPAWMVQQEWKELLATSLQTQQQNWNALMHYGVMLYEDSQIDEAIEAWQTSIAITPSVWVYRNLAIASKQKGDFESAISYMDQAFQLEQSFPDRALAEEYLNILMESKRYEQAWQLFTTLPDEYAEHDRIQIIVGAAALALHKHEFLTDLFQRDFAVIREGETLITDLWYEYHAQKIATERGELLHDDHLNLAQQQFPPPTNIDFRIVGDEAV
ncbi:DUF5107 domain-containing protein [Paenibacillus yanchengensis]|uniref:DUF5107 domain-containing protein n=1 Tax=Paenibacillus yanchengensis TaxID=2035833 RepID=A0ABW4YFV4_9BACL